jgi:hypothetical protein
MTNQIEVNKYEGHTPADAWRHADGSVNYMPPMNNTADVELIADAPLLLQALIDERVGLTCDFNYGFKKSITKYMIHMRMLMNYD